MEDVLLTEGGTKSWPECLRSASAYWDSLDLVVTPGSSQAALVWLEERFAPRITVASDLTGAAILLESTLGTVLRLPVNIEEEDVIHPAQKIKPSFTRLDTLRNSARQTELPSLPSTHPPIIAFYSFKGGVGRTTSLLMAAQRAASLGRKILIIDGDLEAPGLTWLALSRNPSPDISYADFLALIHSDPDPEAGRAVDLTAEKLSNMSIDGLYVMPSFRDETGLRAIDIAPAHITANRPHNFYLTELIGRLGQRLGVDAIFIDLRAGLSELSAGLLLDSRIVRCAVTSTSGQSLEGTIRTLNLAETISPGAKNLIHVILTQVTDSYQSSTAYSSTLESLYRALEEPNQDSLDTEVEVDRVTVVPFSEHLQSQSIDWDLYTKQLTSAALWESFDNLLDVGGVSRTETAQPEQDTEPQTLEVVRSELAKKANALVYAEKGIAQDFLVTDALRSLATQNLTKLPVVIVPGAKGSGKTYTFLQTMRQSTWQSFVKKAAGVISPVNGFFFPVLAATSLDTEAREVVERQRNEILKRLNFGEPATQLEIKDKVRESLTLLPHEGAWRQHWLDLFAWSLGFRNGEPGAGRGLPAALLQADVRVILTIDGLEDLFQYFDSRDHEQLALRALLQEVPVWLQADPSGTLGLLTFVRRDLVTAAIRQNTAQLLNRYDAYALRWDRLEALRLALWIYERSRDDTLTSFADQNDEAQVIEQLTNLWGKKLGNDKSREGRSHEWILAALSDLKGQIQARDLVRFLADAAAKSRSDKQWPDRVLAPSAIRSAIETCSIEKIREIEQENKPVKSIFDVLRSRPAPDRQIPFSSSDFGLTEDQIKVLQENGVIHRDQEQYYMPEIYRRGLEFSYKAGARPRVLALARTTSSRR